MKKIRKAVALLMGIVALALVSCASVEKTPNYAYTEQEVQLNAGMYYVPGILVKPKLKAGQKIPAVVMLHGTASQKNEVGNLYQRLAVSLAKRGYASLRIDFAGTGDSLADYKLYNLTTAKHDTKTALNYLVRQEIFDLDRMGLIGFSQGGLIAQLVAAEDKRIKAMVTWSSVVGDGVTVFESFFDKYYAEAKENGFAVVTFPWRAEPLHFGLQWFNEISSNTSFTDMKNYQGKLLAVAGTEDTLVPPISSTRLVNTIGPERASLMLIDNADHLFNVLADSDENTLAEDQTIPELVLQSTTDWFAKTL